MAVKRNAFCNINHLARKAKLTISVLISRELQLKLNDAEKLYLISIAISEIAVAENKKSTEFDFSAYNTKDVRKIKVMMQQDKITGVKMKIMCASEHH
jgi:hypothetical protein